MTKTLGVSLPRHLGWRLAWVVLTSTIGAYLHRGRSIDIYVHQEDRHG